MSLHTAVYLDLPRSFPGLPWLRDRLAEGLPGLAAVTQRWGPHWSVGAWVVRGAGLWGPGGFRLEDSEGVLAVHHILPFKRIVQDAEALREAVVAIAGLVGATRALYTHELAETGAFDEGLDLDTIGSRMRARFGAPSASFDALADADDWGAGCWFVQKM